MNRPQSLLPPHRWAALLVCSALAIAPTTRAEGPPALMNAEEAALADVATCAAAPIVPGENDVAEKDAVLPAQRVALNLKPSGRKFYEPKEAMQLFGAPLRYYGPTGSGMAFGPNVTVEGARDAVAARVTAYSGQTLQCEVGECRVKIGNQAYLVVYTHPTKKQWTIVQCAYVVGR